MKKILLAILLLTSLVVITGCSRSKSRPEITDPEGIYLTAKEGDFTYTLKNLDVYNKLKSQVGLNMLLDEVDKDLLKVTKNSNNVSYWDAVTADDIAADLHDDIFPNNSDEGLTPEEITTKTQEYKDELYVNYGLVTDEDINNYYHLNLAKKAYANALLTSTEYSEDDYNAYFNTNYKNAYYAIVVSFDSIRAYTNALKQLGIGISGEKWIKLSDSSELTTNEIVKAYIDLYNMNNSYKVEGYPNGATLTVKEGDEYSYVNGNIVFDLAKCQDLFYSNKDIKAYQPEIEALLHNDLTTYPNGTNWYTKTAQSYKDGARQSFVLKLGEKVYTLDEVKADIKDALTTSKLSSSYITQKMVELRGTHNLVIYDDDLETKYVATAKTDTYTYKETKKTNKTLVATTDLNEYSADQLFEIMNKSYGMSVTSSEVERQRLLINTNYNKIYNVTSTSKKEEDKILNQTKWTVIQQEVKDEKKSFEDNVYSDYGYPSSYGWENFLRDIYGVNNEDELAQYFLYTSVRDEYATQLADLTNATETSDLWNFYKTNMEKMKDDYFSVTGVHLLISVNDASGKPLDPSKWTDNQIEDAEEFYGQIMAYLSQASDESYADRLQDIVNAYLKAPRFVAGKGQTTDAQDVIEGINYTFNGIELSKFKTAGLSIKYENLNTFSNGTMVKEFNDAAKSIWEADPDSTTPTVYGLTPDNQGNYTYLKTTFGYHVYVNQESHPIAEWAEGKSIPELADIKIYIENNNTTKLSSKVKTAITTYYTPIYNEIKGNNNVLVQMEKQLKGLEFTFTHDDFTKDNFVKYLDLTATKYEKNLTYK